MLVDRQQIGEPDPLIEPLPDTVSDTEHVLRAVVGIADRESVLSGLGREIRSEIGRGAAAGARRTDPDPGDRHARPACAAAPPG